MTADPRIDAYEWSGGREAMLRFGPEDGPVVVVALPLFEEANRTRAFMVAILRALAVRGIGSVLPDVPGQGESVALLETVSIADMRAAFGAIVERVGGDGRGCYTVCIRSGALIADAVLPRDRKPGLGPRRSEDTSQNDAVVGEGGLVGGRWQLAPQDGAALLRELSRMTQVDGGSAVSYGGATPVVVAGNLLSPAMLAELAAVGSPEQPGALPRVVRLSTDPAAADRHIDGPPLWRRSEPGTDDALSQALAADIADWIVTCER